ncbi:MAG: tryptophan--tRNA ligase [Candidatus Colwellbacteria bacterium]|nr:tryptophan--tRNA ligase [Candidatus Colwellbacteria bacterium]
MPQTKPASKNQKRRAPAGAISRPRAPAGKQIVVSGVKPSGMLHLGNYLGMLKNALALAKNPVYETLYFIADYHALTQNYDPAEKERDIAGLATDLLALGLDPKTSTLFIQSHVPAHANLAWLLGTLTSTGKLGNMIEYKEKVAEGHTPNTGLFTYPILMAADILIYNAAFVPVGEDQLQHLELAREIARAFNNRFGALFHEPQALLTETTRVMSLDNPTKKMSKSLPKGCIFVADIPETIRTKVRSAVTDSGKEIVYDPKKKPALSNLLAIYAEVSGEPIEKIVSRHRNAGYAEFKLRLAEAIAQAFAPFRKKREKLIEDRASVVKTFREGSKRASKIAEATLASAKKRMGLI